MKFAQLVMGSAGTGKSTYCDAIQQHAAAKGRTVRVANFDPAAEHFKYPVAFDIRDLISVDDVQAEMQFGPNVSRCAGTIVLRWSGFREVTVSTNSIRRARTFFAWNT